MTLWIAAITRLLLVALLAVVLYRRKHRYCYWFAAYVAAQASVSIVASLWPAIYGSWNDFADKETLYAALRILILAELAMLIFRTLPRARKRVHAVLLFTLLLLAVVLQRPYDTSSPSVFAREITSRFSYVTAWGLIGLLLLVVWYRLPLHPFHKAILHGMLWLLLIYFGAVYSARAIGAVTAGNIYNTAQMVILALWICAAWASDPPWSSDEAAVIRYLQPWRAP
jgi:hypothetical protein